MISDGAAPSPRARQGICRNQQTPGLSQGASPGSGASCQSSRSSTTTGHRRPLEESGPGKVIVQERLGLGLPRGSFPPSLCCQDCLPKGKRTGQGGRQEAGHCWWHSHTLHNQEGATPGLEKPGSCRACLNGGTDRACVKLSGLPHPGISPVIMDQTCSSCVYVGVCACANVCMHV